MGCTAPQPAQGRAGVGAAQAGGRLWGLAQQEGWIRSASSTLNSAATHHRFAAEAGLVSQHLHLQWGLRSLWPHPWVPVPPAGGPALQPDSAISLIRAALGPCLRVKGVQVHVGEHPVRGLLHGGSQAGAAPSADCLNIARGFNNVLRTNSHPPACSAC